MNVLIPGGGDHMSPIISPLGPTVTPPLCPELSKGLLFLEAVFMAGFHSQNCSGIFPFRTGFSLGTGVLASINPEHLDVKTCYFLTDTGTGLGLLRDP